ncbi:MAG: GNAT family N-acetyltransferase [Pseudomonadota bacterium]
MTHTTDLDPLFVTKRLVLRAPTFRDAPRIAELLADGAVARSLARIPYPYGLADAQRFLGDLPVKCASGASSVFAIDARGERSGLIGIIGLERGAPDTPPTLGYWLGEPYWGRGFMSEAVGAAIAFARDALRATRILSGYFVENAASARIQEKHGFTVCGQGVAHAVVRGEDLPHVETVLDFAKARAA